MPPMDSTCAKIQTPCSAYPPQPRLPFPSLALSNLVYEPQFALPRWSFPTGPVKWKKIGKQCTLVLEGPVCSACTKSSRQSTATEGEPRYHPGWPRQAPRSLLALRSLKGKYNWQMTFFLGMVPAQDFQGNPVFGIKLNALWYLSEMRRRVNFESA